MTPRIRTKSEDLVDLCKCAQMAGIPSDIFWSFLMNFQVGVHRGLLNQVDPPFSGYCNEDASDDGVMALTYPQFVACWKQADRRKEE